MQFQDLGTNVTISETAISALCHRWKIRELALFGSVLRDDFGQDSDLDILVTFADDANWGLLDHIRMESEFEGLFGRDVDLDNQATQSSSSRNWLRKQEILGSCQVFYAKHSGEVTLDA